MNDLQFYVLFNSISVISEQREGDNKIAMEPHRHLKIFLPPVGMEPRTARTASQAFTGIQVFMVINTDATFKAQIIVD